MRKDIFYNIKIKSNTGITIIALIITIIVMLILAGVTINLTIGENGIFTASMQAKEKYKISEYKDKVEIARVSASMNNMGQVTIDNLIAQIYKENIVPEKAIIKLDDNTAKMVTKEGFIFIITLEKIEYAGKGDAIPTPPDLQNTDVEFVFEPDGWTNGNVKVSIKGTVEENFTIQYSLDNITWKDYTGEIEITENKTVYACIRNAIGERGNYLSAEVDKIDKQQPNITEIKTTLNSITIIAKDEISGIIGYAVTNTNEKPTSFTSCASTKNLETEVTGLSENTTYYTWVKDEAGNVSDTMILKTKQLIELENYETAGAETYVVPETATYRLECWGGSGGDIDTYTGGNGAYTVGDIELTKGTTLYLYIGGQGTNTEEGGYNGGGSLKEYESNHGSSGGGATDIRISGGSWDNIEGLRNRIMVAAGGGGANNRNRGDSNHMYGAGNGGAGGELIGEDGISEKYQEENGIPTYGVRHIGTGGTQSSGGRSVRNEETIENSVVTGLFGNADGKISNTQSGGGSGYYAGGLGAHGGAGGGSSFISGHIGCNAIDVAGNHTGQPNHYSGYVFTNTNMIAGSKEMKNPRESGTMIGNDADGYIRISIIK